MAKFNFTFTDGARGGAFDAAKDAGDPFTTDDILEVLRPAAMRLKEIYQEAIRTTFQQRTGSLADSIDFEDNTAGGYAFFMVKPFGSHKGGAYARRSRAGSSSRKYAKHGRSVAKEAISNEELGYLLNYGAPRISATHWMENANDSAESEIQDIVENNFDELLKRKGLT